VVNPLTQPYRPTFTRRQQVILCLAIGFFVFLFNFLIKPLGFSQFKPFQQIILSLSFGVITSFVLMIFKFLLEPLVINERWTLGKNIMWEIFMISTIGVAAYFYIKIIFHLHFQIINLLISTGYAILVGIIISTVKYYIVYNRMYKSALKEADIPEEDIFREDEIIIRAGNPKNQIKLDPKKIIYLCSNDNYVTIVTIKGESSNKITIRGTLTEAESDLRKTNRFLRCHKCFIVNTGYIDRVKGPNQNMTIILSPDATEIPVSRKKAGLVIEKVKRG
jgi:hypothetical protein